MPSRNPLPSRRRALFLALAAVVASGAAFAETATVLKNTPLRATPAASADVVAQLKAKDNVDVVSRQGAWANVTAAGVAGWARILDLRSPSAGGASPGGGANLGALFASGSTGATSTTGAKGLSAHDLQNASPNAAELSEMDGFAASPSDAQSFAGQAPVQARKVDYVAAERRGRRNR